MAKRKTTTQPAALEFLSSSVEETQAFGEQLGRALRPGDVVALQGELGAGKTTLIQGIARGLGRDPGSIKSPTFVLMREYPGEIPLIHIDGYRLEGAPSVAALDVELIFSPEKITLIEWADRFTGLLPDQHLSAELSHVSTKRRRFAVTPHGDRAAELVENLKPETESTAVPAAEGKDDVSGD